MYNGSDGEITEEKREVFKVTYFSVSVLQRIYICMFKKQGVYQI